MDKNDIAIETEAIKDDAIIDDAIEFLLEQIKELKEQNAEFQERLEKLENQKAFVNRDINNKLSNYAQKAIEGSKGPLKADQLRKLLTDDVFNKPNKKTLPIIRKYSNNIDGVKKQILWIYDNVETHLIHRKQEKELDDKLIKKIKKIHKTVEEEQEKENKSPLKQTRVYQYFNKSFDKASDRNRKKKSELEYLKESDAVKNRISVKQTAKNDRKRKAENTESPSSQESGVNHVTVRFSKRLNIQSSECIMESTHSPGAMSVEELDERNSQHTEPMSLGSQSSVEPKSSMSVEELDERNSQHTEPMSLGSQSSVEPKSSSSTEDRQSSPEPMSLSSTHGSPSSTEPMSIVNSQESSSQSDSMTVNDSKTVKKPKSIKTLRGQVSEQQKTRFGKDALDHNGNEETVNERSFRVRKK